jgi:signal transduction histidine kinase
VGGLLLSDPAAWPLCLTVLTVLTLEWPFHIQLAEGAEIYLPAAWTSTAAAYLIGPAVLPVFWVSSTLGFVLIVVLDGAGLVRATGITAESVRRVRGEPSPPGAGVDGHLRQFVNVSDHAVRVAAVATVRRLLPDTPLFLTVVLTETVVAVWLFLVPIPGRMAPRRGWARLARALGPDMLVATAALQVVMVIFLLLCYARGGAPAWVGASISTLVLHAVLKRLNDTRVESERRRRELVDAQDELARRGRLAMIGRTASTVFHQIGRQHGAIGMFAHLLAREAAERDGAEWARSVRDHARGILASVEEANRVIDELLRFGQDRSLNLYPQSLARLVEECASECRPRASERSVQLAIVPGSDTTVVVDKHKVKQAIANLLDNAIDATPAEGRVEVRATVEDTVARITVRDWGSGVAPDVRDRLFTPFCTTKAQGIGLGLALARELVEAHGGTLEWTAVEPGAAFVVSLPLEPNGAAGSVA